MGSSFLTFFYIGPRPAEEVASLLKATFPAAPNCRGGRQKPAAVATKPAQPVYKEVPMPVSQGKLIMGFTAGEIVISDNPDYYAMCLFAEVFGGTPSSKLFMNVRERLSLCYYCGAYFENYKGIIYVSSGIDTKNRSAAESEVLHQLEEMKKGNISTAELSSAALSMCNSYRKIEDNPFSILSFCFGRLTLGLDISQEAFIERIMSVSTADVAKAARLVELKAVYFLAGNDSGGKDGSDE
jgi:predicted Zn-dependent peptidase